MWEAILGIAAKSNFKDCMLSWIKCFACEELNMSFKTTDSEKCRSMGRVTVGQERLQVSKNLNADNASCQESGNGVKTDKTTKTRSKSC